MRLNVGDWVEIRQPSKRTITVFLARVDWVEEREAGTYFGYTPILEDGSWNWRRCQWGCAWTVRSPRLYSDGVTVVAKV